MHVATYNTSRRTRQCVAGPQARKAMKRQGAGAERTRERAKMGRLHFLEKSLQTFRFSLYNSGLFGRNDKRQTENLK
jgi:hypothetical protein